MENVVIRTRTGISCYLDYAIYSGQTLLVANIFDATEGKVNSVSASICGMGVSEIYLESSEVSKRLFCSKEYKAFSSKIKDTHSYFVNNLVIPGSDSQCVITSTQTIDDDLYHYFMNTYSIPIMPEWIRYILTKAEIYEYILASAGSDCAFSINMDREIDISENKVKLSDLVVLDFSGLTEEGLKYIITEGLQKKEIRITEQPVEKLNVSGLDDYMVQFADSIIENTSSHFKPLTWYAGSTTVALKNKKLFPQQAMVVNGLKALHRSNSKYGLIVAEMGTGKTIMGESFVESLFVEKAMRRYNLSQMEVYKNPELVNYRVVIMAPGHLVQTWKRDIEKEIPYAKVEIINNLSQLISIRENGKERNGREFYILGKDFAKLSSTIAPIPTKVKICDVKVQVCADCAEGGNFIVRKCGRKECSSCHGKNFRPYLVGLAGKHPGLICPNCSNLLLSGNAKLTINLKPEEASAAVLTPRSFRTHKASNDICYHCGAKLWGIDAKNINADNEFHDMAEKGRKWKKVKAYKNVAAKAKKSATGTRTFFSLKGYEESAYLDSSLALGDSLDRKSRKISPAQYIKKYLKGFFDICILDEVHKFEGAGTAQSIAAHAIIKASNFTLGLTGTLTNGTAASLFYLLYMLDPVRMQEKGYAYSDAMEFVRMYGTIETEYSTNIDDDAEYMTTAKGRSGRGLMHGVPKIKPGISPLIYAEYLLDKAIFLNISDFSNFLPKFTEHAVIVREDEEVMSEYRNTMKQLISSVRSHEGHGVALTGMLQCGLSYTDKPYGRSDILSTKVKDYVVASYADISKYRDPNCLLEKEKKLIALVKKEVAEDRNIFVFATYTGQAESNICYRLQDILELHCNLKGAVQVMEAQNPSAAKRADWIHKKASEGIRVFICNPALVETGLDFKFDFEGKTYNYPTIMFYQLDYKLATFWQASRRAFRLNQTEECRNYYFATARTAQEIALEVIMNKKMAASALQGNFSAEGLEAMSSGLDEKTILVQKLMEGSSADTENLANMFDVLSDADDTDMMDNNHILEEYRNVKNFYELTGLQSDFMGEENKQVQQKQQNLFDYVDKSLLDTVSVNNAYKKVEKEIEDDEPKDVKSEEISKVDFMSLLGLGVNSSNSFFNGFSGGTFFNGFSSECNVKDTVPEAILVKTVKAAKKKKMSEQASAVMEAQLSFDF